MAKKFHAASEDDRRKAFKHTIHMIQSFNHETASTDGDQPREHQPHEHDENNQKDEQSAFGVWGL